MLLHTARAGSIACVATKVHSGRTTQVWDATVTEVPQGCSPALARRCKCRKNQRENDRVVQVYAVDFVSALVFILRRFDRQV